MTFSLLRVLSPFFLLFNPLLDSKIQFTYSTSSLKPPMVLQAEKGNHSLVFS